MMMMINDNVSRHTITVETIYSRHDGVITNVSPHSFPPTVVSECCQVMFDYTACTEDELSLRKGDIVSLISKVWVLIMFPYFPLLLNVSCPMFPVSVSYYEVMMLNFLEKFISSAPP